MRKWLLKSFLIMLHLPDVAWSERDVKADESYITIIQTLSLVLSKQD